MSDTAPNPLAGAGVYALANKPTVALMSPMDALKQAGEAAATVNANRLFQARVAAGQAQSQAIDPDTGDIDPRKANRLLSQDPRAAAVAGDTITQNQGLQGQQQSQAIQRVGWMSNALGSLLSDNDGVGPTMDRVQQTLDAGAKAGILTQADRAAALTGMPTGDDPKSMSTRLHMLQTVNEQLQSAQQRLTNTTGTAGMLNTGGGQQPIVSPGQLNPSFGAPRKSGAYIPTDLSVGEATAPETRLDPSGRPITAPRSTFVNPAAVPPQLRDAPAGGGRYPSPQASDAPAVPGAGGVPAAGPAPGTAERNASDTALYTKDLNNVQAGNARVQTLQESQSALRSARTGKISGGLQTVLSVINTISPNTAKGIGDFTGTDVEKYDLAKKYLTDYMRNSGSAGQSDAQLAAAAGSNASVDITNQAAQHVVSLQIGRERQQMAQVQEFPDKTGVGYGQASSQFSSRTDPRGFAWDTYSPEQQKVILDGVKGNKTNSDRLVRSIGMAKRLGMISPGPQ